MKNFVTISTQFRPKSKALANELMVTIAFITIFVSVSSVRLSEYFAVEEIQDFVCLRKLLRFGVLQHRLH